MSDEDDAELDWMAFITLAWHDELSDTRQDIYTLDDGEAIEPCLAGFPFGAGDVARRD